MPSRASNGSIMRSLSGESSRQVAFLTSGSPSLSVVLTDSEASCPTHLYPCEASLGVGRNVAVILQEGAACGGFTPGPESRSLGGP